uniref:Uncharacterized protein n=1 Tax=Arundo donax TaxID=35708 RepID=A0A0A9B5V6_ARUDO
MFLSLKSDVCVLDVLVSCMYASIDLLFSSSPSLFSMSSQARYLSL